jgi:vibriolysin
MSLRSSVLLLALVGCATSYDGVPVATDYRFDQDDAASLEDAESLAWDAVESGDKVLAGVSSFTTTRVGVDSVGMAHVRLQQDVDGIPVFGGEAIVHLDATGAYVGVTDDMVRDLDVDTEPLYTADEALDIALDTYGEGNGLKHDATASLVVLRVGDVDHLAYKVRIPDVDRDLIAIPVYFVDAHDGSVVQSFDDAKHVSLSDADKTTYDLAGGTRYSRAVVGDSSDADLDTTHSAIASTLAYYAAAHGRDSFNGTGGKVLTYGHYSRGLVNAYWDGTRITVGDGDGVTSDYLGVLDVMAHEFSHGVTEYEANLTYSNESGALNEATSDIFAAAVEAYVDGAVTADTWDIGEDCWLASPALRYMDAPSTDGSSRDHYSARYTGTSDNGGVHWNSGIANHFFYLLAAGGQHHTAAYRTGTVVTGLGIDAAADIWYLALSSYMTSSTTFAGAATATLSRARPSATTPRPAPPSPTPGPRSASPAPAAAAAGPARPAASPAPAARSTPAPSRRAPPRSSPAAPTSTRPPAPRARSAAPPAPTSTCTSPTAAAPAASSRSRRAPRRPPPRPPRTRPPGTTTSPSSPTRAAARTSSASSRLTR